MCVFFQTSDNIQRIQLYNHWSNCALSLLWANIRRFYFVMTIRTKCLRRLIIIVIGKNKKSANQHNYIETARSFFINSWFKFLSCLNFVCLFTDPSRQRRKRSVSQRPHISTIKEFKEAEEDTDPHKDRLLLVGTQATIMIFITKHYCKLKLSKIY